MKRLLTFKFSRGASFVQQKHYLGIFKIDIFRTGRDLSMDKRERKTTC